MTKLTATRRQFFGLAAGGAAAATLAAPEKARAQVATKARIVIIGAGAGGTALANRLVTRLDGADITLIDPRAEHLYQPGLSLVAAGLKPADYVVSKTTDWLPDGVTLIAEAAAEIDPEGKTVTTTSGQAVAYDFLVVAPGRAVRGMGITIAIGRPDGSVEQAVTTLENTWAGDGRLTDRRAAAGGIGLSRARDRG